MFEMFPMNFGCLSEEEKMVRILFSFLPSFFSLVFWYPTRFLSPNKNVICKSFSHLLNIYLFVCRPCSFHLLLATIHVLFLGKQFCFRIYFDCIVVKEHFFYRHLIFFFSSFLWLQRSVREWERVYIFIDFPLFYWNISW